MKNFLELRKNWKKDGKIGKNVERFLEFFRIFCDIWDAKKPWYFIVKWKFWENSEKIIKFWVFGKFLVKKRFYGNAQGNNILGITASTTTDFPLPSVQLIEDGFLSVQKLPDKLFHHLATVAMTTTSNLPHSFHFREIILKNRNSLFYTLRNHIHTHSITSTTLKSQVDVSTSNSGFDLTRTAGK